MGEQKESRPPKGSQFTISTDPDRYEVRGVSFTVKHVVVSPKFRQKYMQRGPAAFRTFVTAHQLYREGEGDVLVMFVELLVRPPDGTGKPRWTPCHIISIHEADLDSPSWRWTSEEQQDALHGLVRMVLKVPAGKEVPLVRCPEAEAFAEAWRRDVPIQDEIAAAYRARDRAKEKRPKKDRP